MSKIDIEARAYWQTHYKAQQSSGKIPTLYCQEHGISPNSYRNAIVRYGLKQIPLASESNPKSRGEFIEITSSDKTTSLTIKVNGIVLEVHDGCTTELLK